MAKDYAKIFYNSAKWQKVRAYVLRRDFYMCRVCAKPNANIVHHIKELTPLNIHDASVTLDPDNLITVCAACHDAIHDRYQKAPCRYAFDADGNVVPTQSESDEPQHSYTARQKALVRMYRARLA